MAQTDNRAIPGHPESKSVPRCVRPCEVEKLWGINRETLGYWRKHAYGPPFFKISRKIILYPVADLEAWLAGKLVRNEAPVVREG
jgi:hypothetical protein